MKINLPPKLKRVWDFLYNAINAYLDNYGSRYAAALAFFALFSVAPLLVIAAALAVPLLGESSFQHQAKPLLADYVGREGATLLLELMERASQQESPRTLVGLLGLVVTLYGASRVFQAMQDGLNIVFRVPRDQQPQGFKGIVRTYLLSFALVPTFGTMGLLLLIGSITLVAAQEWLARWIALPGFLWQLADALVSWIIVSGMIAVLYKVLPARKLSKREVALGAALTGAMFVVGKVLISLYLARSAPGSIFGAAGTLAALLMWLYLSANIFILGAELTNAYVRQYGSWRDKAQKGEASALSPSDEAQAEEQDETRHGVDL